MKECMQFEQIKQCLTDFKELGAKSIELTGGGQPTLYRDRETKQNINDIIRLAADLKYDIGIITNDHDLKILDPVLYNHINWIRVSLIKLDEGIEPEQYTFNNFPLDKMGFSYIIYSEEQKDPWYTGSREYKGTTPETIRRIARLVELHPDIKFVRIAGNCLIKGNNAAVSEQYKPIIDEIDKHNKFFIKDIGYKDGPYDGGCYMGLVRPYIAPHPTERNNYQVYICTSHVLNTRTYETDYSLGPVSDIKKIWAECNARYAKGEAPYEVRGNNGKNWCGTCKFCYYQNNNQLLHTVSHEMPDKNFP